MSDYSLDYEITIRGRIPCKTRTEQQECIDAANMMDLALPAIHTRTGSNIELTSIEGGCYIQIDKNPIK